MKLVADIFLLTTSTSITYVRRRRGGVAAVVPALGLVVKVFNLNNMWS